MRQHVIRDLKNLLASLDRDARLIIRSYIKRFWEAQGSYHYLIRVGSSSLADCQDMETAVDVLQTFGMFPEEKHDPMPTLEEFDEANK